MCALALVIDSAPLRAQEWNFTFNDGNVVANGTLWGDLVSAGEYEITSGSLTITSGGFVQGTGDLWANPNSPSPTLSNNVGGALESSFGGTNIAFDDLLFPGTDPQLDTDGLIFIVDGVGVNLYANGVSEYAAWEGNWAYVGPNTSNFATTLAPEGGPSVLYLLMAGIACFGVMLLDSRSKVGNEAVA
jgi:hypothetical protein